MQAIIRISMDNDAFQENTGGELANILRQLAEDVDFGDCIGPGDERALRDYNGNRCGTFVVQGGAS